MATHCVQMKFQGMQNATFDKNPHANERIGILLGCAISFIARAKHGCTGGWLLNTMGSNTYSYLHLYSNTQIFVFVFIFEKYRIGVFVFVFERCIWTILFKYNSNFERISAELNNIGSVTWSMLPLTNWIITHSYCNVKFPITAWIYNTNDSDELLTMTLFKFVLPNLCLL